MEKPCMCRGGETVVSTNKQTTNDRLVEPLMALGGYTFEFRAGGPARPFLTASIWLNLVLR